MNSSVEPDLCNGFITAVPHTDGPVAQDRTKHIGPEDATGNTFGGIAGMFLPCLFPHIQFSLPLCRSCGMTSRIQCGGSNVTCAVARRRPRALPSRKHLGRAQFRSKIALSLKTSSQNRRFLVDFRSKK